MALPLPPDQFSAALAAYAYSSGNRGDMRFQKLRATPYNSSGEAGSGGGGGGGVVG
jgi:hypothetical protein